MRKEPKYQKQLELILLLASLLSILFLSTQLGFVKELKPDGKSEKVLLIVGMFFLTFAVLAIHELGHLFSGLIQGFRFELFVVGPFGMKREHDRIKIYLNKNLAYYGGVAATSPRQHHPNNARKFARILLAGPIASLLFGLLSILIAYWIGKPYGLFLYVGGVISLAIFLATTIPSKTGMFFTDRKRYQRLVRPGKDQAVELSMLRITAQYAQDSSYRNIDQQDIQLLIDDDQPFIKFFGLFNFICLQLENHGEVDEKVMREYDGHSNMMSKNLVVAFNKEIEKLKAKTAEASTIFEDR